MTITEQIYTSLVAALPAAFAIFPEVADHATPPPYAVYTIGDETPIEFKQYPRQTQEIDLDVFLFCNTIDQAMELRNQLIDGLEQDVSLEYCRYDNSLTGYESETKTYNVAARFTMWLSRELTT